MTAKRFESRRSINKTGYVVTDNEKQYTFPVMSEDDCYMFCKVLNALHEENEMRKEPQRTLEDKIRRLKDRVKTFEKHYSLKDIERYKKMDNCNCIHSKRLK